MNAHLLTPRSLSVAIALLLAGGSIPSLVAGPVVSNGDGPARGPDTHIVIDPAAPGTARWFVQFNEAPLAMYDGSNPKFAAIPRTSSFAGKPRRLDPFSSQAKNYVAHLASVQAQHVADMSAALGRNVAPLTSYRYALNADVVEMTPAEARSVAKLAGVREVRPVVSSVLATDIGPQFIGATNLWTTPDGVQDDMFHATFDGNTPVARYDRSMGDGVVVGDIDTGYNSLSPSFSATDDTGYTMSNPLGAGNYLGECSWLGISDAGCNSKVIGSYAMVADTNGTVSVEDTQGHGSHTGSTAAGNSRSAQSGAFSAHISGVAPHANLVVFHACAPAPANCPSDALTNAVEQAISDGVVDAINYSISGGVDPWNDITSQAFLSAEASGIFVAAAAGNTGTSTPVALPGTANHLEPWVTTVAAGTHSGGPIGYLLSVDGNSTPTGLVPANTGTKLSSSFPSTPIVVSPTYGAAGDGCSAFAAGTFSNSIALLKFDSNPPCDTNTRAQNATLGGASAVIIGSPDGQYITSGANQAVPVFTTTGIQSDALATYLGAHAGSSGSIAYPASHRLPVVADSLAVFSLRGPSWMDVMKPDVQAPGVSIIAAVANDGSPDGADNVAFYDGTSMATPHTTGAAALLIGLHPDWTPMEIKSALMMTAKEAGLTGTDGVTPSGYFDRGAGRIVVDAASKAGLVLDETAQNMQDANPALGGAGLQTLNLASLQDSNCASGPSKTCSVSRTFRSTIDHSVTWTASYSGEAGLTASVSPSTFSVSSDQLQSVALQIDASGISSSGAFHFGEVILTPDDVNLPKLHLPMAIAVQPPQIAVVPSTLAFSIPSSATTQDQTLTVMNVGGPTLNISDTNFTDATPQYAVVTIDQSDLSPYGGYSSYFTDFAGGRYAADDFTLSDPVNNLSMIRVVGFSTNTPLSSLTGKPLHFRIYHDAGGKPDGAPEAPATSPNNPPAWQFDTTIGAAGVDVTNDVITLNLAAASAPDTNLAPGTYWLTAYPEMNSALNGGWAVILVDSGNGNIGMEISPTGAPSGSAEPDWTAYNGFDGFAFHLEQRVACGVPWLTTSSPSLSVGAGDSTSLTVTADSSNFDGGVSSEVGYLCLRSNDTATPTRVIRVTATQH